ncbi:unnamed protein product [Allacma fusca]|uniref:Uncharacterized protein n=1 Tax=Allacma fusca TaxID=39272 RepID=A0A8J2JVL7_9HEXA|nr:unnamed protein product [Allacma fusca]
MEEEGVYLSAADLKCLNKCKRRPFKPLNWKKRENKNRKDKGLAYKVLYGTRAGKCVPAISPPSGMKICRCPISEPQVRSVEKENSQKYKEKTYSYSLKVNDGDLNDCLTFSITADMQKVLFVKPYHNTTTWIPFKLIMQKKTGFKTLKTIPLTYKAPLTINESKAKDLRDLMEKIPDADKYVYYDNLTKFVVN